MDGLPVNGVGEANKRQVVAFEGSGGIDWRLRAVLLRVIEIIEVGGVGLGRDIRHKRWFRCSSNARK